MKPYKRLGKIANPDDLLSYCKSLRMKASTRSYSAEKGRLEAWIKYGSNLQSLKPQKGENNIRELVRHKILTVSSGYVFPTNSRIDELGYAVMKRATGDPHWDSCFVTTNGGINWHRDHGIFQHFGAIINLGSSATLEIANSYSVELEKGEVKDKSVVNLSHGDVIGFNTKCLHRSIVKNKEDRYMMLFHRFKSGWSSYLPKEIKRAYERRKQQP
jgi:hypothetical protein